ncbi:hypothetical protein OC844_007948, partial [Tilletia horrida]
PFRRPSRLRQPPPRCPPRRFLLRPRWSSSTRGRARRRPPPSRPHTSARPGTPPPRPPGPAAPTTTMPQSPPSPAPQPPAPRRTSHVCGHGFKVSIG